MMSRSEWTTYPNHIRRFRKRRGLRLRDVSRLVGMRVPHHVSRWESGSRVPTLDTALRLSAILQCPVEVLFSDHYRTIREEVSARQEKYNIRIEY